MNITYTNTISDDDCNKLRTSARWPQMHPDQISAGLKNMEYIHSQLNDGYCIQVDLMAAKGREAFYEKFGFVKRPDDNWGCGMTQRIKK